MGIKGTYYFRIVPQSWDKEIIRKIAEMRHEIGYHYETMDTANGDIGKAYKEFTGNLKKLRSLVHVSTIAMHGSPLSKYDNKDLWKAYDYKNLGLIAEPYFDINVKDTRHFSSLAKENKLPNQIMINIHPQRWFNPGPGWLKELILQNIKNQVKKILLISGLR